MKVLIFFDDGTTEVMAGVRTITEDYNGMVEFHPYHDRGPDVERTNVAKIEVLEVEYRD